VVLFNKAAESAFGVPLAEAVGSPLDRFIPQRYRAAHKGGLPEPQVQGIGGADENSFLLRMGGVTQLTSEAAKTAGLYREILGPGNFYLEIMDHGIPEERLVNKELLKISAQNERMEVSNNRRLFEIFH
jgi:hypothetical protein